jgi:SSS family solute:Na+ symporter
MYTAQNGYEKGFAGATPGILMAVAMAGVGLTGFVIKPLRDSAVMTIPELLDQRFGSRVRWAAGVVIVLGGLLNMGVFLRTGGQFLVLVAGLDVRYLEIMMTALLVGVAVYTILTLVKRDFKAADPDANDPRAGVGDNPRAPEARAAVQSDKETLPV